MRIIYSIFIAVFIVCLNLSLRWVFDKYELHNYYSSFLIYSITFSISILVSFILFRKLIGAYRLNLLRFRNIRIAPIASLLPILLSISVISNIIVLIPISDVEKNYFLHVGSDYSFLSLLHIILIAPILEEILFRDLILRVLLLKYPPFVAIIFSGLIFACIHYDVHQMVNAFSFGIVTGWIFWKTENVLICIIMHISNNLFFTWFGFYFGIEYLIYKPIRILFGNLYSQAIGVIFCLTLFFYGIYYINRKLKKVIR